jgi:hypothetical protein
MSRFFALSLWPALAWADAIEPPPESCPDGSNPTSSHAGSWCEASYCPTGTCSEGSCRPVGLCVLTEERSAGGWNIDGRITVHEAFGPCDGPEDCERGTCEIVDRCAPAGLFGGWRCDQAPTNRVALTFGVIGLGVAAFYRRKRAAVT